MASLRYRNDSIFLDYTFKGKRQRVSLCMKDTASNRKVAETKLALVNASLEADKIGIGKFDLLEIFPYLEKQNTPAESEAHIDNYDALFLKWVEGKINIAKNMSSPMLNYAIRR